MNAANRQSTRWLTLIGTIITQFALGSVYTWSLFNSSLSDKLGEPVSQVAFSFGLLSLGWRSLRRSPASCRSVLA
mgnify:CR=1 FL=1